MQERKTNHILLYLACEQNDVCSQTTTMKEVSQTTQERMVHKD